MAWKVKKEMPTGRMMASTRNTEAPTIMFPSSPSTSRTSKERPNRSFMKSARK